MAENKLHNESETKFFGKSATDYPAYRHRFTTLYQNLRLTRPNFLRWLERTDETSTPFSDNSQGAGKRSDEDDASTSIHSINHSIAAQRTDEDEGSTQLCDNLQSGGKRSDVDDASNPIQSNKDSHAAQRTDEGSTPLCDNFQGADKRADVDDASIAI